MNGGETGQSGFEQALFWKDFAVEAGCSRGVGARADHAHFASMFLYPLGRTRTRIVGARTRVERFARGVEEAARQRGIFHFCPHPENRAEHPCGLSLLDDCLAALVKVRDRGDVEVLTVEEVARRAGQLVGLYKNQTTPGALEATRELGSVPQRPNERISPATVIGSPACAAACYFLRSRGRCFS